MSSRPNRTFADSETAKRANGLVESLQLRFVEKLRAIEGAGLLPIDWLRDQGRHGGGRRYAAALTPLYNRASVNVSHVHYDDMPEKRLRSATALSTIIHPQNPKAPSMHMHISWTEMRQGQGYWRLMADLNPAQPSDDLKARFEQTLKRAAPEHFDEAKAQGERYFFIPVLDRHRGVSHFYLEGHNSGDFAADEALARTFGEAVIDEYAQILADTVDLAPDEDDRAAQFHYHTVYLFQVLTLDRGTTSGVLVHDQNDVGILASLPSFVDRDLLASWIERMPAPQDQLLSEIVAALPVEQPCAVTDEVRAALAKVLRRHYTTHPDALKLQASGDIVPPTVQNHR